VAIIRVIPSASYQSENRPISDFPVPPGYSYLKFTFDDETWPVGFNLDAQFQISRDNGNTFRPVGGLTATEAWVNPGSGLIEPRFVMVSLGFVSAPQTRLQGNFTPNNTFNTRITVEGFE